MLVKISLVVALCFGVSMDKINARIHALESQNPGSKITLRIDRKATCDSQGNVIESHKTKRMAKSKSETFAYDLGQ